MNSKKSVLEQIAEDRLAAGPNPEWSLQRRLRYDLFNGGLRPTDYPGNTGPWLAINSVKQLGYTVRETDEGGLRTHYAEGSPDPEVAAQRERERQRKRINRDAKRKPRPEPVRKPERKRLDPPPFGATVTVSGLLADGPDVVVVLTDGARSWFATLAEPPTR
jgi:hypothetical protein